MGNLPLVRGVSSKKADEVVNALGSVMTEVDAVYGSDTVNIFHSGAGGEFINAKMTEMLKIRLDK